MTFDLPFLHNTFGHIHRGVLRRNKLEIRYCGMEFLGNMNLQTQQQLDPLRDLCSKLLELEPGQQSRKMLNFTHGHGS